MHVTLNVKQATCISTVFTVSVFFTFQRYKALGDFHTSNQSELSFREGDLIEVVRAGSNGWWFAKHLTTHKEGWAPSNYLEPIPRSNSQFSVSSIG